MGVRPNSVSTNNKKIMFNMNERTWKYLNLLLHYLEIYEHSGNGPLVDVFHDELERHLIGEYTDETGARIKYMKYNLPPPRLRSLEMEKFMSETDVRYEAFYKNKKLSGVLGDRNNESSFENNDVIQGEIQRLEDVKTNAMGNIEYLKGELKAATKSIAYVQDTVAVLQCILSKKDGLI